MLWLILLSCQNDENQVLSNQQCYYPKRINSLLLSPKYDVLDIRWTVPQEGVCLDGNIAIITDHLGVIQKCIIEDSWVAQCDNWTGTLSWTEDGSVITNALHLPFGRTNKDSIVYSAEESILERQARAHITYAHSYLQENPAAVDLPKLGSLSIIGDTVQINGKTSEYKVSNCILNRRIKQPYKTLCLLDDSKSGFAYLATDTHYKPRWIEVASIIQSSMDFRKVISTEEPLKSCFDQSGRPKVDLREEGGRDYTGKLHRAVACDKSVLQEVQISK
jgi:hypothetical protein